MAKESRLRPLLEAGLLFAVAQIATLYAAHRGKIFVERYEITSPQISAELPLVYFFGAVVMLGIILFLVPVSKLRIVLKILFASLFAWGTFVAISPILPIYIAVLVSIGAVAAWFFRPKIWLHDLLMLLTLVAVGAVFGFLLSPWAVMVVMLVLSLYDFLAVRFGYMLWMARKLCESETLPAFFIPKKLSGYNLDLREVRLGDWLEETPEERGLSLLGGGDIGFPLVLIVSVFFIHGIASSVILGVFSLSGLASAYLFQLFLLKGKPMPALPPISLLSLVGFLIVNFIAI